ncbi:hypothetical protein [Phenylobacterium soli]|uniref:Invasion associated locus B family protein n=1 Tax=Phenylobacterium soli TaxID=2170551 RepID=A0A328AJH1_9CAUL|nr:hypothetical protein [Phenylobacterium soli]RAK54657.1 hypothetical protein DJ017_09040 [Phenylobacterium soli]
MIRYIAPGVLAAAVMASAGIAAPTPAQTQPQGYAWIVSPDEDSCHTEIELTGKSGATAQVELASDGQLVQLKFAKDEMPKRAFLAIDIDRKPYSNLLLRLENPKVGAMTLSDETLNALRKGGTLLIAWLADEPMSARLAGSEQAINDLRTCGAQVAAQYRANLAARQEAEARAAADARAQKLADEQLALVKAQKEAAEAQAQHVAAETKRREEEAEAQREAQRQQALAEQREQQLADQRRAAEDQRQEYLRRYYPQYGGQYAPPPGYGRYPNEDDGY